MSGTTRNKDVLFVIVISFVISHSSVNSLGKRSFGESCRFGGRITSFFSQDDEESRTCDNDMGLICTGTYCACPPGRVWDNGDSDSDRGSPRGCAGAVGSPCFGTSRNQQCVSNAHCQFAFCRCKPNFRPNGGHCFSTNFDGTQEVRPATGINFPELQQIFGNYHNQHQQHNNNHQVNSFNDNSNNFNDRFHKGDDDSEIFNDRFYKGENREIFNDRFHNGEKENRFNDRFHSNNGNYHDHQNSRDGSKGSSNVRFEE